MARGITNFRYRCDPRLSETDRIILADQIIERIIERSQRGNSIDNTRLAPYSDAYRAYQRKIGLVPKVDLTLTGEMLNAIQLLNSGTGFIEIGITPGTEANRKARWNQGGNRNIPSRPFMGIRDSEADAFQVSIVENSPAVAAERFLEENNAIAGIFNQITLDFGGG